MPVGRHPGQAAHDVDAEFEPQGMHIIRQGLEALAVRRAGEAVLCWQQAAETVHHHVGEGLVSVGLGGGLIPLNVHHYVFPAVVFQVLRHVVGVSAYRVLGHRRAVAVPAVPAHGWVLRDHNNPLFLS